MTEPQAPANQRTATVRRVASGRFEATNVRGGTIRMGTGDDSDFSPVELLLAAMAGCSAVDVDAITARRSEPEVFEVRVQGNKVNDANGHHLADLVMTFEVRFPAGVEGDAARERLPQAIRQSHESLCTVSRTVELSTPVEVRSVD